MKVSGNKVKFNVNETEEGQLCVRVPPTVITRMAKEEESNLEWVWNGSMVGVTIVETPPEFVKKGNRYR